MKTNYLFILAYLFLAGCSSYSDSIENQEVGYIDYMTCPEELITAQDSFLLANIDFQEGKLICLLDDKSVAKAGISPEKYGYFLEYLQNRNLEIEKSVNAGNIVVFRGKPYTRNEEVLQNIEFFESDESRATDYNYPVVLYSCTHEILFSEIDPPAACFTGPAKISITVSGRGNFRISDGAKNLEFEFFENMIMSSVTFKWGIGNYPTNWRWDIHHFGETFDIGTVTFYGYLEKEPPAPSPTDPNYWNWYNNLPNYVQIMKITSQSLGIRITKQGSYTVRVYGRDKDGNYNFHSEITECGIGEYRLSCPAEGTFWVVVFEEIENNGRVSLKYIGDILFRNPNLEGYPLDQL